LPNQRSLIHSRNIEGGLNFKNDYVIQTTPLLGRNFYHGVGLAVVNPLAKFKEYSFIHSRNIEQGFKFLKGSHDPDDAPFMGNFLPLRWDLP